MLLIVCLLSLSTYVAGKGTFKWKANGCLYDGDWKDDMRSGFGTYSVPNAEGGYQKQYSGGWKNNKKHVVFILYFSLFTAVCYISMG
jgi:hypothetical protein